MAAEYRRFAALLSMVPAERCLARNFLGLSLSALSQPHLIDLIVGLGMAFGSPPATPGRNAFRRLGSQAFVEAIVNGMALITEWPTGVRARGAAWVAGSRGGDERLLLIRSLRALGDARVFGSEVARVIRSAIPEAFVSSRRALGGLGEPIMVARDVLVAASINSAKLEVLDASGLLSGRVISNGKRRQRQYSGAHVEALARRRLGSSAANKIAQALSIPVYGIEQLACLGTLEWENDARVLLIEPELRIVTGSVDSLAAKLVATTGHGGAPACAVSLWSHLRQIGGGAKPWGEVLTRIAKGQVPVWSSSGGKHGGSFHPMNVMICPSDFSDLQVEPFPLSVGSGMPISSTISQRDACDVLNLDNLTIRPLVQCRALIFGRSGKALRTTKSGVIDVARRVMSASELGGLLGVRSSSVRSKLRNLSDLPALPGGWCRKAAERHFRAV